MSRSKPIFTIPEPPADASPRMRAMLLSMKEAVEVRLGRRGDPLEQAVTKRDLVDAGIAKIGNRGDYSLVSPDAPNDPAARIKPPAPMNFNAEGVFGGITLTWDSPWSQYNAHAYTEIWRSESTDPATRQLINSSMGTTFFDRISVSAESTFYYWIRFVSSHGQFGPFAGPIAGQKQADVDAIMEQISGEINQSDLSTAFQQEVAQIKASYIVKLDNDGYAAGFGLYNSGTTSEFQIRADRFSIGAPGTPTVHPFIVDNGVVYIDTAMIRDASIQQGKLGPISFGKITDAAGNPVTTVGGQLRAEMIDVANLRVGNGNIAGVLRSDAVAPNGQPRWVLDKAGGMSLNSGNAQGRMEIRDNVIKVFDANGVTRVILGDLSA